MLITKILQIRFHQIYRVLSTFGLFRVIFIIPILFFIFLFFNSFLNSNYWIVVAISCLIVNWIHQIRNDKKFIKLISSNASHIFFYEYLILLSPIILLGLLSSNPISSITIILSVFFIAHLDYNIKINNIYTLITKNIPSDNFEWISGVRRSLIGIFIFYILGLALAHLYLFSLVAIWIISSLMASFYEWNEPLQILLAKELNACDFLKWKLKLHVKSYLIFISPIILIYSIFNYHTWYITLVFLLLNTLCYTSYILIKYSTYIPNKRFPPNPIIIILIIISNVFFPLFILSGIIIYNAYYKSLQNLKIYFNDYN